MSENLISPQEVYDRLINEASDGRRKRSLEAIHQACRLLNERNSSDFSYRNIITLGKDRELPIPGEKSIVNSTGVHYRELIQAWKLASPAKAKKTTDANDWIEAIEDPVQRLSVQLLAKELRAYKAKEARKDSRSDKMILEVRDSGSNVSIHARLTEPELEALKLSIDPDRLKLDGLSIGARGEVLDAKGKIILRPGFRSAIEKLLSLRVK
jgi:hypothetical protein